MLEDDTPTQTSKEQTALEKKIAGLYQELDPHAEDIIEALRLMRTVHVQYLHRGLGELPSAFACLDASRPWIVYWIVHSLSLLGASLPEPPGPTAADVVSFLKCCQCPQGGFGGSPRQIAHLAPSYAAVCALVSLGGEHALQAVDRQAMFGFLCRMAIPPNQGGGFCIHEGGEGDLRACFIAMAIAHMLHLDKDELVQRSGVVEYVKRCQTYEGGLGGEPGNEAHGGYTFCGLAAMAIIGREKDLDLPALARWAAQRQATVEGGFNGRTNKLADGCYSFWQGGLFSILQRLPPSALWHPHEDMKGPSDHHIPVVPPLPPLGMPHNPVEQANAVLVEKQAIKQQLTEVALQAGERVNASLQTGTERSTAPVAQDARVLLDQAGSAQAAAEAAHVNFSIANCAAALLFPVPDPTDPPLPTSHLTPTLQMESLSAPLYNYKALQLWILKCCQHVLRGGLRDKPGKSVDFYHTCYCLSGLASAQHASNCVLGPGENLLKCPDPMCNVVEEKLVAARQYYAAYPISLNSECERQGTMHVSP
mmetsp:Transcript_5463/g.14762  ORF Transcript_5463/g.14762 Transcript_5463/m.14762 type:complete len:536 (+) Transcript_5463:112-1719(+)